MLSQTEPLSKALGPKSRAAVKMPLLTFSELSMDVPIWLPPTTSVHNENVRLTLPVKGWSLTQYSP